MDYDKDFKDQYVQTKHGRIHMRCHSGGGKSLVFLHGIGANTKTWVKLVGSLPQELDVYLVDLLGHGDSEAPQIEYTVQVQAEVIEELIRSQEIKKPYLIGHSYGGWIAAYYAVYYDMLSGLVLMDSVGVKQFFDDILSSGSKEQYKEDLLKKLLAMNTNKEYVMRSALDNEYGGEQLDSKRLGLIFAKTLLIWGANDTSVDIKYGRMFLEAIADSKLEIVSDAGHNAHYSHAEEVWRLLINFINQ